MAKLHTHYDNLKVTRNAPAEVIRAAYKTLSQKYHPDKHPGNADAERVMALINTSYQVLSDPLERAEHDRWIAEQEAVANASEPGASRSSAVPKPSADTQARYPQASAAATSQPASQTGWGLFSHVLRYWQFYGLVGFLTWVWVDYKPSPPPAGPKPYQAYQPAQAPVPPPPVRPATAANGQPWPAVAGYVKGLPRLHADGLSTVTVDNSRNDSDVFVKLVSLDGAQAYPVRQFFIPAFGRFTLKNVTAGSYDVRYRDLDTGGLSRSEAFNLNELDTGDGTQYSTLTMTLYKVQNGNMQTYRLSESEF